MNTETRQVFWSEHENAIKSLHNRADIHLMRLDALSARVDALEQDRKRDRARLDGQSNAIQALVREMSGLCVRVDAGFAHIRDLRTDPVTQPLPASPAPVEPDPAPETIEQTATRLLSNPETFAAVLRHVARHGYAEGRLKLHDAIRSQEAQYHSSAAGLRLLAATIAAGSFA